MFPLYSETIGYVACRYGQCGLSKGGYGNNRLLYVKVCKLKFCVQTSQPYYNSSIFLKLRNSMEAFAPDFPIVSSLHKAVASELHSRYSIVYILLLDYLEQPVTRSSISYKSALLLNLFYQLLSSPPLALSTSTALR